jgi:hypothetical protein
MKGGVIPATFEKLKELFQRMVILKMPLAIHSQHEGNCASDSIQIVLFFSDRIGPSFAKFTIDAYNEQVRLGNNPLATEKIKVGTSVHSKMTEDQLALAYRDFVMIRYLKLIDEYQNRVVVSSGLLQRTESHSTPFAYSSMGTLCSSVFAVMLNKKYAKGIPSIADLPSHDRNMLFAYSPDVYDPIVTRILSALNPRFQLVTGSGNNLTDLSIPNIINDLVGLQIFCTSQTAFHTFTFFRFGGKWFIGDNEVGIAIPTNFRTEHIISNSMVFNAVVDTSRNVFTRTYTYGKFPPIQITYALTSATSGNYVNANEDETRTHYGMYRKYYLASPVQAELERFVSPLPSTPIEAVPSIKSPKLKIRGKIEDVYSMKLYKIHPDGREDFIENVNVFGDPATFGQLQGVYSFTTADGAPSRYRQRIFVNSGRNPRGITWMLTSDTYEMYGNVQQQGGKSNVVSYHRLPSLSKRKVRNSSSSSKKRRTHRQPKLRS